MPGRHNPMLYSHRLGSELRRLRQAAGLTIAETAGQIHYSPSWLSRIETGQVSPTMRDIGYLLVLYNVSPRERESLLRLARRVQFEAAEWHVYRGLPNARTYASYESGATSIHAYAAAFIPGLLQTAAYARRVITTTVPKLCTEDVERHLELRLNRQRRLTPASPLLLSVVVDEAVVRRLCGAPWEVRQQLRRLVTAADMVNVMLQVLPLAAECAGAFGMFSILGFANARYPDIVYLEHLTGELYVRNPEEVQQYKSLFTSLQTAALPPEESIEFLRDFITQSRR